MWKHEILDSRYAWHPNLFEPRRVEAIRGLLKNSTQFFFGDYESFQDEQERRAGTRCTIIPAPHKITLITYSNKSSTDDKDRATGQITRSTRRATLYVDFVDERFIISFYYVDSLGDWVLCPVAAMNISGEEAWTRGYLYKDKSKIRDTDTLDLQDEVTRAMLLLGFLNAKNIVTKCVMPRPRINKKRQKHGQDPIDKYYILEVCKGAPTQKYQGEVPWDYKSPENVAFHICRGHFKTYTEDSPLFGKYAGTFWWQPQARGKVENGTITKDYAVIA